MGCHLLAAFHKYALMELMTRCENRVIDEIYEENAAERFMMADLLDIESLRSATLKFMTSSPCRLARVQATDAFQNLIHQRPQLLAEILAKMNPPAKRSRATISKALQAIWVSFV